MTYRGLKRIVVINSTEEAEECCRPEPGSRIRGIIQPWILLLLAERPSHGYQLLERLHRGSPETPADTAMLYRTLRQMEADGLVVSAWETGENGPAKRLYRMTDAGVGCLRGWAGNLRRTRDSLDEFLALYETQFGDGGQS